MRLIAMLSILLFTSHMSVFAAEFDVEAVIEDHDIAPEKPFYEDHARGWHWYEAEPRTEYFKKEQVSKTRDSSSNSVDKTSPGGVAFYPATEELKQYQAQLEESKALAVMRPTPQNVLIISVCSTR